MQTFVNIMQQVSLYAIPLLFLLIPMYALFVKKVQVYEVFCEGAKDGFDTAVRIIPFLVGMLVAVGMLRASGAIDMLVEGLRPILSVIGFPSEVLPIFIMNPVSGGAARGALLDIFNTFGVDSFLGKTGSAMFGSTDTTLYVLAVYFGSVGISRSRHAVPAGFLADAAGMLTAIYLSRIVFGG